MIEETAVELGNDNAGLPADAAPDAARDADAADSRTSRRDALKKAAAGGAIAGALWVAPKVEGLSLVPEYASAGTVRNTTFFVAIGGDGPSYPGYSNWFSYRSGSSGGWNGPTQNTTLNIPISLGAAGNAVMTIPQGTQADGNPFTGNVAFNVDPPFNQCRITGLSSSPGPSTPDSIGPAPVPNNVGSFTQWFNMGDHPGPTSLVDNMTVTITCS